MTETTSSGTQASACKGAAVSYGATLAFLVLRFWLAIRAIVTGLEKFAGTKIVQVPLLDEFGNQDISGAMVETKVKVYGWAYYHGMVPSLEEALRAESLMPGWALTAYGYALGPALILTGIALLLGAFTRLSLFAMGLIYGSLTIGLILLNQDGGIAWLGTHVVIVALALKYSEYNRFCICPRCAKY